MSCVVGLFTYNFWTERSVYQNQIIVRLDESFHRLLTFIPIRALVNQKN